MFNNILIYVDQNLAHTSLIECAINVANKYKSTVTLIGTIYPLDERLKSSISAKAMKEITAEKRKAVQLALDNFIAKLKMANIIATSKIKVGTPFIEITKQVMQNKHNLVMLLADDHQSGLSKAFFGSTQMHLLRKCPSPVWIVKPETTVIAQNILAPVDLEFDDIKEAKLNQSIVKTARAMAQTGTESITFMHVWSLFGENYFQRFGSVSSSDIKQLRSDRKRDLKIQLQNLVDSEKWNDFNVEFRLPRSDVASAKIIKTVKKQGVDLLIMGTLCRTGIKGFVVGNTAEKILNEVSCSVLALKPAGFVSPIE